MCLYLGRDGGGGQALLAKLLHEGLNHHGDVLSSDVSLHYGCWSLIGIWCVCSLNIEIQSSHALI